MPIGLAALATLAAAAPDGDSQPLTMAVEGLRSTSGNILVCVTQVAAHFPDCSADPARMHRIVPAAQADTALGDLPPGDYAIAIIHDENGNGRLDTFAGIPREGVGFSRNPALRFGPPRFSSARFAVAHAPVRQAIRVKYFL
ncbi:MAG: DUF2141 domain-containing protein [Sphingobium sp.]